MDPATCQNSSRSYHSIYGRITLDIMQKNSFISEMIITNVYNDTNVGVESIHSIIGQDTLTKTNTQPPPPIYRQVLHTNIINQVKEVFIEKLEVVLVLII